jgi:hypothetical protein
MACHGMSHLAEKEKVRLHSAKLLFKALATALHHPAEVAHSLVESVW